MPNRIVRDGILFSVPVSMLSPEAELLYRKLMSVADDFGRFYAAPIQILLSSCYPLQVGKISEKDISKWMKELGKHGLVDVYETEGKKVLEIIKFNQRRRATKSKFPGKTGSSPTDRHTNDGHVAVAGQTNDSHMTPEYEYECEVEDESETRTVGARGLPKGWAPNESHEKIAAVEGVNLAKAADIFRDWAAEGHKRKNWNATFSNALRNENWMKRVAPAKRNVSATGTELKKIQRR